MADSRETGMRVGAATNQAVAIAAALIETNQLGGQVKEVATYVEELAPLLLVVMNDLQGVEAVKAGFTGTVAQAAAPAYVNNGPAAPRAATAPPAAAADETVFSGSSRPLKLSEHAELPAWLHAQAAAIGVAEVWDNRGKDAYKAAIAAKLAKTPPPFRSATDGIDKSFWPTKN